MRRTALTFSLIAASTLLLPGCEMLGIETPAGKASVFEGWKEMDADMRENEIVGMPSTPATEPAAEAQGAMPAAEEQPAPEGRKPQRS